MLYQLSLCEAVGRMRGRLQRGAGVQYNEAAAVRVSSWGCLGGMMAFLGAVALAFGMFSRIPVPRVAWSGRNMRFMLCAFPLVGAVIGAAVAAAVLFVRDGLLMSLCAVVFPVAVTGGIHVDGFMDTCDALASHAGRERKLAIMQDSHAGAFAVLGCVLYIFAQFVLALALWRRTDGAVGRERLMPWLCVCASFVLSRLLSACSVAVFPAAKDSGLLRTFADAAARRFTAAWSVFWFVAFGAAMAWFFGRYGVAAAGAQAFAFVWYFLLARRHFGGITGDTAGWFVQVAELASLAAVTLVAVSGGGR